jgi:hypothetical protein
VAITCNPFKIPIVINKTSTMKHIILSVGLLIAITCFVGCKKDNPKENNSTSIIGTWELRSTTAAMEPGEKTYPPGNGDVLKFTATEYEVYKNNQLVKSGQYKIIPDSTVTQNVCLEFAAGRYPNRIIYDTALNNTKEFMEISGNKLTFIAGCYAYDAGHTLTYEK